MFQRLNVVFCFVALSIAQVVAISYQDVIKLENYLLRDYSKTVRPRLDQTESVGVMLGLYPYIVHDLDEVSGTLTSNLGLYLEWKDDLITWNTSEYPVKMAMIPSTSVWRPKLVLINKASPYKSEDTDITRNVIYYSNGLSTFMEEYIVSTTCSVTLLKYPFDAQNCTLEFHPVDYTYDAVFITNQSHINTKFLSPNSQWEIFVYGPENEMLGHVSYVTFYLTLRRKSTFIIINLLLPIAFLSMINISVFLLPAASGERMSFAITVLLSLAVYVTIVSEKMPSSDPVPIFSYYLLSKLVCSCMIVLAVTVGLQFFHQEGIIFKSIYMLCQRGGLKCSKSKVTNVTDDNVSYDDNCNNNAEGEIDGSSKSHANIKRYCHSDWFDIGALIMFFIWNVIETVVCMALITRD